MQLKRLAAAVLAAWTLLAPSLAPANTTTTNLGLNKPDVGADADAWGGYLNTNADTLEALFGAGPVLLVSKGGTGAASAASAAHNLGLGTADSPTFTGLTTSAGATLGSANTNTHTLTGHVATSGTTPTLGTCGTGATIPAPSFSANDNRGYVASGTGVSACTINFSRAWASTPVCVVSIGNSSSLVISLASVSTTSLQVVFSSTFNGTWGYICEG
jgi:hypothetical protein